MPVNATRIVRQNVTIERSIVLARPNGHEIVTVEDNPTRLRALDQAWTLRQAYPAAQLEVSGRIRVEQLHQIALGVAHLSVPQLRALLAEPEAGALAIEAEGVP